MSNLKIRLAILKLFEPHPHDHIIFMKDIKSSLQCNISDNDLYTQLKLLIADGFLINGNERCGIETFEIGPNFLTPKGRKYLEEKSWVWYKSDWFKLTAQHAISLIIGLIVGFSSAYFAFLLNS